MQKKKPCNEDCFNCIYPDCIKGLKKEKVDRTEYHRAYYLKNKQRILAYEVAYRERLKHEKQQIRQRVKEYFQRGVSNRPSIFRVDKFKKNVKIINKGW